MEVLLAESNPRKFGLRNVFGATELEHCWTVGLQLGVDVADGEAGAGVGGTNVGSGGGVASGEVAGDAVGVGSAARTDIGAAKNTRLAMTAPTPNPAREAPSTRYAKDRDMMSFLFFFFAQDIVELLTERFSRHRGARIPRTCAQ
jgi:hypothetical protein